MGYNAAMKFSAGQIRSRLFDSLLDFSILATAVIVSLIIGVLIASPLWAFAVEAPTAYTRTCFAVEAPTAYTRTCIAVFLTAAFGFWLRKFIFLKKKRNLSLKKKTVFIICRTASFFFAICLILSIMWQLPIPALLSLLFFIALRVPLFLSKDTA